MEVDVSAVERDLITSWVQEVQDAMPDEAKDDGFLDPEAWDDVHGGVLPIELVREARQEEVGYMNKRGIWTVVSRDECYKKPGKPQSRLGGWILIRGVCWI